MLPSILSALAFSVVANAHTAAWANGMYCRNGSDPNVDDINTNTAVSPLFNLTKEQWWFQHDRGCDLVPPKPGHILHLPANGQFTVDLAHNRRFTSISADDHTTAWPDGRQHPEDWHGPGNPPGCITDDGALHTNNQSTAAGTAWAISYNSNLKDVTMENLVVFTTLANTPWKRLATYSVPNLPACPSGGCHCAWLWVPTGCGQPNMYMQGFKCDVTGATSTRKLGTAKAPAYCRNDASKCVKGPKQMIAWYQLTGNNVQTPNNAFPAYSSWNGFSNGAQTDIFV